MKADDYRQRARHTAAAGTGNKYHACRAGRYDSRKEARHAALLRLRQQQGDIRALREQVRYEIIPLQRDKEGRLLERAAYYTADFVYYDRDGNEHVEDVKSVATRRARDFSLRRKLMLLVHGIRIQEV